MTHPNRDNRVRDRPVKWIAAIGRPKNARMAAIGRLGGLIGGRTRAVRLTPAALSAIGRKGALARWGKA
jgi:hypothetical protein